MSIKSILLHEGQKIRAALRQHQADNPTINQKPALPNDQHGPSTFKLKVPPPPPTDAA